MRKDEATMKCAKWLAYCLKIGWRRDDLDRLEALWWQYHDENGGLINDGGLEVAIGVATATPGHQ